MTISAQIIADSISPEGIRLTTMQLRYPRFIHSELLTHRVFSRNSSSSRAIPVKKLIEDIRRDPAMPIHWGKNQPGMQARESNHDMNVLYSSVLYDVLGDDPRWPEEAWNEAMVMAIQFAEAFAEAGYHKQIVNRLLEPFAHINVVVTSTQWSNFYALRAHPDAQPEIKALAEAMKAAQDASEPVLLRPGQWHLPYVTQDEIVRFHYSDGDTGEALDTLIKVSVARCARVSYLTHDGRQTSVEEDVALHDRLLASVPRHASPAEHPCTPDRKVPISRNRSGEVVVGWELPELHGNTTGWIQYRKTIPGECQ